MRAKIAKRVFIIAILLMLTAEAGLAAKSVIITRAFVDLNRDGKKDQIAIIMTSGRRYVANDPADDSCPSCMCGASKYVGKFAAEVRISGGKLVRQNLNTLIGGFDELMFWAGPWQIVFDDYNHDGRIDFNLGQYVSCNGWAYWLLTVGPDGRVSQLKVEEGNPSGEIFASDDANSTRLIRHTAAGFYTKGYFNGADPVGFYTSYYAWNPKKRLFIFAKDVYDRDQKQKYYQPRWAKTG